MLKKETTNHAALLLPMLKTVEQMNKVSGIGENKLHELIDSVELEYIKNGNCHLIANADIWDWYHKANKAAKEGRPYYDNELVVAKPDGAPSWVSSQFVKMLEELEMPNITICGIQLLRTYNNLWAVSTPLTKSWDILLRVSARRLGYK